MSKRERISAELRRSLRGGLGRVLPGGAQARRRHLNHSFYSRYLASILRLFFFGPAFDRHLILPFWIFSSAARQAISGLRAAAKTGKYIYIDQYPAERSDEYLDSGLRFPRHSAPISFGDRPKFDQFLKRDCKADF